MTVEMFDPTPWPPRLKREGEEAGTHLKGGPPPGLRCAGAVRSGDLTAQNGERLSKPQEFRPTHSVRSGDLTAQREKR